MNAKANGVLFDAAIPAGVAQYNAHGALGKMNSSWSLVWLTACWRELPSGAKISNSVAMRMQGMADYRPENLPKPQELAEEYAIASIMDDVELA